MKNTLIPRTPSAHDCPLLIRSLLEAPVVNSPGQEIVYRNLRRQTYRELIERIHRLAGALTRLGVRPGDTVAVMDWDSHRYLECFFAVPMIGAVLHTVILKVRFVEAIDRTSVGKVNKVALRKKYLEPVPAPVS